MSDKTTEEQIKELIIARLQAIPPNVGISVGSQGDFKRDELIEHVKKDDEIGKKIIEIDLNYLRALKELNIYA